MQSQMLNPTLYKTPALLDRERHRSFRLREDVSTLRSAEGINVVFITLAEFEPACRDYPVLFVRAGQDALGRPQVAPVAVMGFEQGENLCLKTTKAGRVTWACRYIPAFLRVYPFTLTQVDSGRWGVCIDEAWQGWSTTKGAPLFDDGGQPSALSSRMHDSLKTLERDIEQTRLMGERLMHAGVLQERLLTVKMPDGSSFTVQGFLAVDADALNDLPKMQVSDLHRSGFLHGLSLHRASLGNLEALAERRWKLRTP